MGDLSRVVFLSVTCILCSCLAAEGKTAEGLGTAPGVEAQAVVAPESPAPDDPDAARPDALREILARMGVHCFFAQRKVEVNGWVNMQSGLIEVFACTPEGKVHEAVVVLDCVPSGLHAGLLALGLEPGTPVEIGADGSYRPPTGDRVEIRVRTIGAQGQEALARAEDWVWNRRDERPLAPCSWIFAGSLVQSLSDDPEQVVYAADRAKSLVTTYHDATSILEIPDASGVDDTLYYANEHAVPPAGTPVTVIFSPVEER